MNKDIRWKQRFQNFEKSIILLKELNDYNLNEISNLQREGFIQRFEVCFEQAWKTLKDYLEYLGNDVLLSPRPVVKEAFAVGIVQDGQVFIDIIDDRNKMSHIYDEVEFNRIFSQIVHKYAPALFELCDYFKEQI